MEKRIYTPEQKERKRLYDIEYRKQNAEKKKEQQKQWRDINIKTVKQNNKEYCENNKERKRLYDTQYRKQNAEKKKERDKEYYQKNKKTIIIKAKQYRENNKDKINFYNKNRFKTDNLFRLNKNISNLVRQSFKLKGFSKKSKTANILGCTFEEFKQHIESKFEPWMNWNNYGNTHGQPKKINISWDLDHIIPISSAKTDEDLIKLNHYSNLQPLCSYTNRWIKIDKVN